MKRFTTHFCVQKSQSGREKENHTQKYPPAQSTHLKMIMVKHTASSNVCVSVNNIRDFKMGSMKKRKTVKKIIDKMCLNSIAILPMISNCSETTFESVTASVSTTTTTSKS